MKNTLRRAHIGALIGALVLPLLPLLAAAAPPLAQRQPLPAIDGEVIVKFKADAATVRARSLSARDSAADVRAVLAQRARALGARTGHALEARAAIGERTQVMRLRGMDAAALAAKLAADPEVEYAEPNRRVRALAAPTDPLYLSGPAVNTSSFTGGPVVGQWYLRAPDATVKSALDLEPAWARTLGSASVVVAVIDTGVRFEHPDLGRVANGGRLLPGYDFVDELALAGEGDGRDGDPSDPGDWTTATQNNESGGDFHGCGPFNPNTNRYEASTSSWHGTATTSLVAAAQGDAIGMTGAAPGVRVLPIRGLGKCGLGDTADIQAAMRWAAGIPVPGVPDNANPARVINLSLGGDGACTQSYKDTISQVLAQGTVIVAAAGNSTGGPVGSPANCPGVIGVLALRHVGTKVGFSDLGPEISISAPGGNCINITLGSPCLYPILAATDIGRQGPTGPAYTDSFNYSVGTSFSSPLVAGVAALMLSQQPALTPAQVLSAMKATARPFPTTGGDNGDGSVVPQCHAPASGVDQLQCYCTTAMCGAGMLDAGAAVAAVSGPVARITVVTASPTAGAAVSLGGGGSLSASGTTITAYAWSITSTGGIVTDFTSATNAATASITPTAAGNFSVRLEVTDSAGVRANVTQIVTVAAAPVAPAPAAPARPGGGGAASLAWVLGVLLAAGVLRLPRRGLAGQGLAAGAAQGLKPPASASAGRARS